MIVVDLSAAEAMCVVIVGACLVVELLKGMCVILDLGIPRIQEPGIIMLGSPIGNQQFVHDKIQEKIQTVKELTKLLPLIKDLHSEFVLLQS